eukprot:COSAG02_NODE_12079_length_1601_cov_5.143529_3_plen_103_part_00
MMDATLRDEFMATDAIIKELGGEDEHITADLPSRWTDFADFNGVEAMNSDVWLFMSCRELRGTLTSPPMTDPGVCHRWMCGSRAAKNRSSSTSTHPFCFRFM